MSIRGLAITKVVRRFWLDWETFAMDGAITETMLDPVPDDIEPPEWRSQSVGPKIRLMTGIGGNLVGRVQLYPCECDQQ